MRFGPHLARLGLSYVMAAYVLAAAFAAYSYATDPLPYPLFDYLWPVALAPLTLGVALCWGTGNWISYGPNPIVWVWLVLLVAWPLCWAACSLATRRRPGRRPTSPSTSE